ncbi:uncharacterized protein V1516DRAFT_664033 [Lipomyces oligophaga]|uniref:uncharacterized protein n=1 Tax=Lipomyces oligophaga TaxID=45792 RepID=UPI0034CDB14F
MTRSSIASQNSGLLEDGAGSSTSKSEPEPPMIDNEFYDSSAPPEVDTIRNELAEAAATTEPYVNPPTTIRAVPIRDDPFTGPITTIEKSPKTRRRRICGLSLAMFAFLALLAGAIIIGLAVGLPVGLHNRNKSSSAAAVASMTSSTQSHRTTTSTSSTVSSSSSATTSATSTVSTVWDMVTATTTYSLAEIVSSESAVASLFCEPSTNIVIGSPNSDEVSSTWASSLLVYKNLTYGFKNTFWIDNTPVTYVLDLVPINIGTLYSFYTDSNLTTGTAYSYRVAVIIDIGHNYDADADYTGFRITVATGKYDNGSFRYILTNNTMTQAEVMQHGLNYTTTVFTGNFTMPSEAELDTKEEQARFSIIASGWNQVTAGISAAIYLAGHDSGCSGPDPMVDFDALMNPVTSDNETVDSQLISEIEIYPAQTTLTTNSNITTSSISAMFCVPADDVFDNARMQELSNSSSTDDWFGLSAQSGDYEISPIYATFIDNSSAGIMIPMAANSSLGNQTASICADFQLELGYNYSIRTTFGAEFSSDIDFDKDYIGFKIDVYMGSDESESSRTSSDSNGDVVFEYGLLQSEVNYIFSGSNTTYFSFMANFSSPYSVDAKYQNAARMCLGATPTYQLSHFIYGAIYSQDLVECIGPDMAVDSDLFE